MAKTKNVGDMSTATQNFITLFSEGREDFGCTKESVQDAISRMRVDGQTYKAAYLLPDVTEENYEQIARHIHDNLTSGDIANSYAGGNPKKVTIASSFQASEDDLVTAVVPPAPKVGAKPERPNGWVRFWNRLGFYKDTMAKYNADKEKYDEAIALREKYDQNVAAAEAHADEMERDIEDAMKPADAQKAKVAEAFNDREKRAALHEAAKESLGKCPLKQLDQDILPEIYQFIPKEEYDKMTARPELSGMGRNGSVLADLYAYMAANGKEGKGMTYDEAMNASDEEKRAAGQRFRETFLVEKGNNSPSTEDQKAAMAEAIAKMYRSYGEETLRSVDMLDPQSIKDHAAHNMMVGLIGMDLGQMVNKKSPLRGQIEQKLAETKTPEDIAYGGSILDHCTGSTVSPKAIGAQNLNICQLYAADAFMSQTVSERDVKRPEATAVGLLYAESMGRFYGRQIKALSREDSQFSTTLGGMCKDDRGEVCKFFNGQDASLGKLSDEYKKLNANHTVQAIASRKAASRGAENQRAERRGSVTRQSFHDLARGDERTQDTQKQRTVREPQKQQKEPQKKGPGR